MRGEIWCDPVGKVVKNEVLVSSRGADDWQRERMWWNMASRGCFVRGFVHFLGYFADFVAHFVDFGGKMVVICAIAGCLVHVYYHLL